ncbi:676_t:CDS:1, partial [Scutellospora calospora]
DVYSSLCSLEPKFSCNSDPRLLFKNISRFCDLEPELSCNSGLELLINEGIQED